MDTEDTVFLNRESLFESRRGGRSQSLSSVPRDEGSAFMPPGMAINPNEDQRGFSEVVDLFHEGLVYFSVPYIYLNKEQHF
jgi:hypothetical protein